MEKTLKIFLRRINKQNDTRCFSLSFSGLELALGSVYLEGN
jgi:hypothetical protein